MEGGGGDAAKKALVAKIAKDIYDALVSERDGAGGSGDVIGSILRSVQQQGVNLESSAGQHVSQIPLTVEELNCRPAQIREEAPLSNNSTASPSSGRGRSRQHSSKSGQSGGGLAATDDECSRAFEELYFSSLGKGEEAAEGNNGQQQGRLIKRSFASGKNICIGRGEAEPQSSSASCLHSPSRQASNANTSSWRRRHRGKHVEEEVEAATTSLGTNVKPATPRVSLNAPERSSQASNTTTTSVGGGSAKGCCQNSSRSGQSASGHPPPRNINQPPRAFSSFGSAAPLKKSASVGDWQRKYLFLDDDSVDFGGSKRRGDFVEQEAVVGRTFDPAAMGSNRTWSSGSTENLHQRNANNSYGSRSNDWARSLPRNPPGGFRRVQFDGPGRNYGSLSRLRKRARHIHKQAN